MIIRLGITLLLMLCIPLTTYTKILIFTHQCDRPAFIEMHYKTFKKFLCASDGTPEDFEYVVFNDAHNPELYNQIVSTCAAYNIRCIDVPQNLHGIPLDDLPFDPHTNMALRHAAGIKYSFEQVGFNHNDIVMMIDCDMILIRPLCLRDYMKETVIASVFRIMLGYTFLWPGLVIFHMPLVPNKQMINFNPTMINGNVLDTGGKTFHYLAQNQSLTIKPINMMMGNQLFCHHDRDRWSPHMVTLWSNGIYNGLSKKRQKHLLQKWGYSDDEIDLLLKKPRNIEFYLDSHFMHFRGIPTWSGISVNAPEFVHQMNLCKEFIDKITE